MDGGGEGSETSHGNGLTTGGHFSKQRVPGSLYTTSNVINSKCSQCSRSLVSGQLFMFEKEILQIKDKALVIVSSHLLPAMTLKKLHWHPSPPSPLLELSTGEVPAAGLKGETVRGQLPPLTSPGMVFYCLVSHRIPADAEMCGHLLNEHLWFQSLRE